MAGPNLPTSSVAKRSHWASGTLNSAGLFHRLSGQCRLRGFGSAPTLPGDGFLKIAESRKPPMIANWWLAPYLIGEWSAVLCRRLSTLGRKRCGAGNETSRRVDGARGREGRSSDRVWIPAPEGGPRGAQPRAKTSTMNRRSTGIADDDRSWLLDRRCRALPAHQSPPLERPSTAWRARCWPCSWHWPVARSGG
jgi:hypothetical protein